MVSLLSVAPLRLSTYLAAPGTSVHSKYAVKPRIFDEALGVSRLGAVPDEMNDAVADHGPRLPAESARRTRHRYGALEAGIGSVGATEVVRTVAVKIRLAALKVWSLFL